MCVYTIFCETIKVYNYAPDTPPHKLALTHEEKEQVISGVFVVRCIVLLTRIISQQARARLCMRVSILNWRASVKRETSDL